MIEQARERGAWRVSAVVGATAAVVMLSGTAWAVAGAAGARRGVVSVPMEPACGAGCVHVGGAAARGGRLLPGAWERAIAANEPFPGGRFAMKRMVAERVQRAEACYAENLSPEQLAVILDLWGGGPAGVVPENRPEDGVVAPLFFSATSVYRDGGQSSPWTLTPSGGANRIRLTYSFPADGVTWGTNSDQWSTGPNELNARILGTFGSTNLDLGREWIRQGLAAWRRQAGINYDEVADSTAAMNQTAFPQYGPGDVRIGGYPLGGAGVFNGVLAYNQFPSSGSDMTINTNYWATWSLTASGSNYRRLRNVVAHEHGHGLGAIHPVPCNNTKLMEPEISLNFDVLQVDDTRFAQRNYGDRFAGNRTSSVAANLGDLTSPVGRSVLERDLSTNGRTTFNAQGSPLNSGGVDWFRFTLSSAQTVTVTVDPIGGSYLNDQQNTTPGSPICSGVSAVTPTVNADEAGDLQLVLYGADAATVVASSTSGGPGVTETVTANLPAGTYFVRVHDGSASNPGVNQFVQLYDFSVRVGAFRFPPQVIAGINKRVQANTTASFLGDVNTRPLESGATISTTTGYQWDLDGDGVFDVTNRRPTFTYVSNGTYPVTLRVTDSFGSVATDTINVVVFGATTTVTGNTPTVGDQGQTVPIVLTGTNFKTVTAASQVTVSGTGVTVTGTPVSNAMGTQLTGLSLVIAPNAPVGTRTITVVAPGTGTGGSFTVNLGVPCPTFTQPPASTHGYVGQSLELSAAATPAGVTYQWFKDGEPLGGETGATLSIASLVSGDAGSYTVSATNACGSVTSSAAVVSVYCPADFNGDGITNLDDLGDYITDFYSVPAVPGGLQPAAFTYSDVSLGYGRACPDAPDAPPPFAVDAYRVSGYRTGYSADGSNSCPLSPEQPFPNLDNLNDFITLFYSEPACL
jgi:hypothetical protein